jgi:hypothetical protein
MKKMEFENKCEVGLKNDYIDNKLRWELLPIEEIEEIIKVLSFGAKKYTPNNWKLVDNGIERYYAALMRHIAAWRKGEELDTDSGFKHLSHAACNLIFLLYLTKKNKDNVK